MGKFGLVDGLRIGALVFGLLVLAIAYFGHGYSSYLVGFTYEVSGKYTGPENVRPPFPYFQDSKIPFVVHPFYEHCENGTQPDMANKTEVPIEKEYGGGTLVQFKWKTNIPKSERKPCPSPMLEKVFIFILGTTFVVAIVFLVLSFKFKPGGKWHPLIQKIEFIYVLVAAGLLVLGAILFLASAVMINNIYNMEFEKSLNDQSALDTIKYKKNDPKVPYKTSVSPDPIPKVKLYFIVKLVAAILGLGLVALYVVLALMIKKAMKAEANAVSPSGNAGGGGPKQDPTQDEANQLSQNPSSAGPPPE